MSFSIWPPRVLRDVKQGFRWPWRNRTASVRGRATASAIVPATQAHASLPVAEVFTPTQPRTGRAMFVGRQGEIETIVQGLVEDKAHVVLYSERGRGKTSLANIVVEGLRRSGLVVVRTQCEAGSSFDSLVRGLARSLPGSLLAAPLRAEPMEGCEAALPAAPLRPGDVVALLPKLRLRSLVCVVDEFDRIEDAGARTMLADTIKQLSDRRVPLLFMVIGVSENLEQLLGQHPSIQRNLVAVALPLLSDADVAEIVSRGAAQAGLSFPAELVSEMAAVVRGWPYLAHLLGLRTAQAAARRGTRSVERHDFAAAIQRLLRETPPRVLAEFDRITAGGQDAAMEGALAEVAACAQDRWGHMPVVEQPGDSALVGGRRVAWACWQGLLEADVLRWCDGRPRHVMLAGRDLAQYALLRNAVSQAVDAQPAAGPTLTTQASLGGR